mmetsp:Transcript_6222/g.12353  ORF Transcript_6222/g.12353 Transcript_6222/m.12353 type:complete len:222 (-) Transcript_6222:1655-2320(-)
MKSFDLQLQFAKVLQRQLLQNLGLFQLEHLLLVWLVLCVDRVPVLGQVFRVFSQQIMEDRYFNGFIHDDLVSSNSELTPRSMAPCIHVSAIWIHSETLSAPACNLFAFTEAVNDMGMLLLKLLLRNLPRMRLLRTLRSFIQAVFICFFIIFATNIFLGLTNVSNTQTSIRRDTPGEQELRAICNLDYREHMVISNVDVFEIVAVHTVYNLALPLGRHVVMQ